MTSKATITLRAILFSIVCPIILIFVAPLAKAVPMTGPLLVGSVASILTFALTILFVHWDGLSLRAVGCGFSKRTAPRLLFGFAIGAALVALENFVIYSGGHAHWVLANSRPSLGAILIAFAGYLALALREELGFRGYSLRRMEDAWGLWPALLVIGAFFTLEHTAGGWTWSRTLLGPPAGALVFGMAALATRGLAVPVGIHAAFNFGQWFMGQKETQSPFKLVVDPGFARQAETLGYIGYLAGMIAVAVAFWFWRKRAISKGSLHNEGVHGTV